FPWTEASHQVDEYKRWLNDDYNGSPWEQIDNLILNLLRVILRDDPTERAKIIDIQSHQWLSKTYPKAAKLPLNVSTISNKWSIDNDETIQDNKKKRSMSKCTSIGKSRRNVHVYCENNDVFDCMLNQTNVENNNNKFYLIQLLEDNDCKKYYVWLRWGRVGYNGQNNLEHFGCDLDGAKRFFLSKIFEKVDENNKKQLVAIEELKSLPVPESKLDKRIQKLIQLICNIQAMEEALLEMKFDARKNPLGKLSSTQIRAGYAALKEIETYIKTNKFNSAFIEANNTYYSQIPHEFDRNAPPLIETIQQLKHEIELLEALDNIEIAFTTLNTDTNTRLNPIDQHYEQLKCKLYPIEKHEDIYILIDKYLQSTHATTHQQYKMEIEHIFKVERDNENQVFKDVGNKMLLWYRQNFVFFKY
ncbi:unnamed protein product, partial [Rotaria sp. Silwood1]